QKRISTTHRPSSSILCRWQPKPNSLSYTAALELEEEGGFVVILPASRASRHREKRSTKPLPRPRTACAPTSGLWRWTASHRPLKRARAATRAAHHDGRCNTTEPCVNRLATICE